MRHYILVEVREPDEELPRGVGIIRRAIHMAATENSIDEGDIVIRGDKDTGYFGENIRGYRAMLQDVFEACMKKFKSHEREEREDENG